MALLRAVLVAALLHVASGQSCQAGEGTRKTPRGRVPQYSFLENRGLTPPPPAFLFYTTTGLVVTDRNAGDACIGDGKIVMSGFTAATDTTLNGIYSRVAPNIMKCRNIAGTLTDGTGSANTAGCAAYCQNNGAASADKCIGDGGREYVQLTNTPTLITPSGYAFLIILTHSPLPLLFNPFFPF